MKLKTLILLPLVILLASCGSKKKQNETPVTSPVAPGSEAKKVDEGEPKSLAEQNESVQAQASEVALQKVSSGMNGWGYEGEKGPENWSAIKPEFLVCKTGKKQSPVNLKWNKPKAGGEISFQYRPEPLKMIDNGSTVEVGISGASTARLHGKDYSLHHIQFHTPSEHTLSGNALPMEAQFFHKSASGDLAAVSVILIIGRENAHLKDVFDNLPKEKGVLKEKPEVMFDPGHLLPDKLTHYHYVGSLTTPPCTEGVDWFVLNTPVELSKAQILQFRAIYAKNSRPLQSLNGRHVVNY